MARLLQLTGAALGLATAAAAETPKIMPGEWESSTTMVMKTMPNVPPQVAAMLRKRQAKPMVVRTCITPQEAARGPERAMADKNCRVNNASYGGGRMSAESVCTHDGDETRMKMTGTYSPTSYSMDGAMSGSRTTTGAMAMTMHIEGRRVSPVCSAASR